MTPKRPQPSSLSGSLTSRQAKRLTVTLRPRRARLAVSTPLEDASHEGKLADQCEFLVEKYRRWREDNLQQAVPVRMQWANWSKGTARATKL